MYWRNFTTAAKKLSMLTKSFLTVSIFLCAFLTTTAQERRTITGVVTDADNGGALSGATVSILGTNIATSTNKDGQYSIQAGYTDILQVSFVNYDSVRKQVGVDIIINFQLKRKTSVLDQVVVIGYGTARKVEVTGAVAQVRGAEINKQPITNAASALQGKVAGVQVTNSGAPGGAPQLRIRGVGSVAGGQSPLYVVDGVWYDDIAFLNPADIEATSILKDASAQSIYGIRAANGVVLITTKRGRVGLPKVTYDGYVGWQKVTNEVKMANGNEYSMLINEQNRYAGGIGSIYDSSKFSAGTDWYHQILRNAIITNHQVSVSGGSEKTTYGLSLSYLGQEGLVNKNKYQRYTARVNTDMQVFKFLKAGFTITGVFNDSKDYDPGIFRQLYTAGPIVPVYYADGTYGDPNDFKITSANNYNPQVTIDYYDQTTKQYFFTGNLYTEVKFLKYFTYKLSLGGEFTEGEVSNYLPVYKATLAQRADISRLTLSRSENRNWILENTITFDRKIKDHNVRFLVGQGAQKYRFRPFTATAYNVPNDNSGTRYLTLGDVSTRYVNDAGADLATVASYFGRLNYSYANKYQLSASLRADGASKFFGKDRWGYFPSIGVGWLVTQENFMSNQKIFDMLRVRASWGTIGNLKVPSNISVLRVTQFPPAVYSTSSVATSASIASTVPPTTKWEKTEGLNFGVEMGFLNNRLQVEADYYNKQTKNAIFNVPILATLGTVDGSILANQATIKNTGIELSVNWRNTTQKGLTYSVGVNGAYNQNEVTKVLSGAVPIYSGGFGLTNGNLATRTMQGQPIGEFYGYQVLGIFQTTNEIVGSAQPNAKPGDFKYQDQNGDGQIDAKDKIVLGNPNPKFIYGINTSFAYKNFDLSLDFQGVAGVQVYNANMGWRYGKENFTQDFYNNRWHGAGTSNTYPSANILGGENASPNSFYVENGGYFRVRNVQLGYTLSDAVAKKMHVQRLRIYANGQNVFNSFKYRGFTPEIQAMNNDPLNAGIDANVYPLFATYNFGINVTF